MKSHYTDRWPELKSFIDEVDERISRVSLPADQVILDDLDVQRTLKISKRKLAQLRAERKIKYYFSDDETPIPKNGSKTAMEDQLKGKRRGKIYYLYCDIIAYVKRNPVTTIFENLKLARYGM